MKTYIILFLLGFFISCSSNKTVIKSKDDILYNPDTNGSVR